MSDFSTAKNAVNIYYKCHCGNYVRRFSSNFGIESWIVLCLTPIDYLYARTVLDFDHRAFEKCVARINWWPWFSINNSQLSLFWTCWVLSLEDVQQPQWRRRFIYIARPTTITFYVRSRRMNRQYFQHNIVIEIKIRLQNTRQASMWWTLSRGTWWFGVLKLPQKLVVVAIKDIFFFLRSHSYPDLVHEWKTARPQGMLVLAVLWFSWDFGTWQYICVVPEHTSTWTHELVSFLVLGIITYLWHVCWVRIRFSFPNWLKHSANYVQCWIRNSAFGVRTCKIKGCKPIWDLNSTCTTWCFDTSFQSPEKSSDLCWY